MWDLVIIMRYLLFLFSSTFFTQSVQLQFMILNEKFVLSRDILLELFNLGVFKFDDGAALSADQVIMVSLSCVVFVSRKSVFKPALLGHSCSGQELERPVHGRITDAGIRFLHQAMQFFRAQMPAGNHEDPEDLIPLLRGFEPLAGQVIRQLIGCVFLHILNLKTIFNLMVQIYHAEENMSRHFYLS